MISKSDDFSDEWWNRTGAEFYRIADEVRHPYLQPLGEAVERRGAAGRPQKDPLTGIRILGIPYRVGGDRYLLECMVDEILVLIPRLEQHFETRHVTPRFVADLCAFYERYGYVLAVVSGTDDDLEPERRKRKISGTKIRANIPKKKYMAKLLAHFLTQKDNRAIADKRAYKHIAGILREGRFSEQFGEAWFKDLLQEDVAAIKTTYAGDVWPKAEVRRWAAQDNEGIPWETLPQS